jgi:MSHA biogenesis protein MshG
MALYQYKGRNAHGGRVRGKLEGTDSNVIANQLLSAGVTPVEIWPARSALPWKEWLRLADKALRHVSAGELMLFSRQMYSLLKSGVPILRALNGLQDSTRNRSLRTVIAEVRDDLDGGRDLSTALRAHPKVFSPFYVSMVQAGEATGTLDAAFLSLFGHIEFEKRTRDNIKAAMRYPSFVVMAMAAAIVVVNLYVIPAFAGVFKSMGAKLPLMTQYLIAFSDFMVHHWPAMLGAVIAAIVAIRLFVASRRGKYLWDRYKIRIPIIGPIVRKSTISRFARSLGLSFRSGVPVVQGMDVVAIVVDNGYFREKIGEMKRCVERGESILQAATTARVFDPITLQMIAVGEETGDLDGMMFEIADMYEREVEYSVKNLSQQIEPVLIVVLAGFVLVFALAIFLPMWDYSQAALHH